MNYEDFNSKKYMILLALMCILLLIMTIKVFDYMPQPIKETELNPQNYEQVSNSEGQTVSENVQNDEAAEEDDEDEGDDEEEDNSEDETDSSYDNNHKHGHIDYMPSPSYKMMDLEEIPAPKGTVEEEINAISE